MENSNSSHKREYKFYEPKEYLYSSQCKFQFKTCRSLYAVLEYFPVLHTKSNRDRVNRVFYRDGLRRRMKIVRDSREF